ncbi:MULTISPECIES: hypothetical protein [Rhodococcus]|uniref:hypothetical protein n=1 Tax=Rhodococcus TaxID=1827 RepID=UPI000769E8DD|nr:MULTISPECIES: hypothetical protein [Rhodococcus]KXF49240.1 hypothetical protein AXA44_25775 [Rhodococcus sp. SC4]UDG98884.1 hypothetical protein K2Z90_001751 [Rhodococcus opacus PD630]
MAMLPLSRYWKGARDDGHIDVGSFQALRGEQPAESRADHHDPVAFGVLVRWRGHVKAFPAESCSISEVCVQISGVEVGGELRA